MKIKVLLVVPNQEVQVVKIPSSLKFIKAFLGNDIFCIRLDKNNILIANQNANIEEFNRIVKRKIILGTFFIVSTKNNHKTTMKKKDLRKYANMFKLRKHKAKIDFFRQKFLEEYYSKQKENEMLDKVA